MTPHSITYRTIRAALRFAVLGAAAYLFGTFVQGLIQAQAGALVVFGLGLLFQLGLRRMARPCLAPANLPTPGPNTSTASPATTSPATTYTSTPKSTSGHGPAPNAPPKREKNCDDRFD
jgi:hypothetical protein